MVFLKAKTGEGKSCKESQISSEGVETGSVQGSGFSGKPVNNWVMDRKYKLDTAYEWIFKLFDLTKNTMFDQFRVTGRLAKSLTWSQETQTGVDASSLYMCLNGCE